MVHQAGHVLRPAFIHSFRNLGTIGCGPTNRASSGSADRFSSVSSFTSWSGHILGIQNRVPSTRRVLDPVVGSRGGWHAVSDPARWKGAEVGASQPRAYRLRIAFLLRVPPLTLVIRVGGPVVAF
jgi:hypothetical protein